MTDTNRVRLSTLLSQHEFAQWSYGNGYSEPYESGVGCSCGVVYDDYLQHRCEADCPCRDREIRTDDEIRDEHLRHVLAVLIRERLLTTSRPGASTTNPPVPGLDANFDWPF